MSLDKLDRQRRLSYTSTAYYDELVFSKELSLCCPAGLGRGRMCRLFRSRVIVDKV